VVSVEDQPVNRHEDAVQGSCHAGQLTVCRRSVLDASRARACLHSGKRVVQTRVTYA
jgi:hypothetical protein